MKKANDPMVDYKDLVRNGYNNCGEKYLRARIEEKEDSLELLLERLPENSKVVDIGCGTGVPVTKLLSQSHDVTGIDISERQIELAKENVSAAKFFCNDITKMEFEPSSFDAIVSFYAVFHIPKEEHVKFFQKISNALRRGGDLLITLANEDEDAYTEDDFFDTTMYQSNYSLEFYLDLLEELNFEILYCSTVGHGYVDGYQGDKEGHPIVLLRKEIKTNMFYSNYTKEMTPK